MLILKKKINFLEIKTAYLTDVSYRRDKRREQQSVVVICGRWT